MVRSLHVVASLAIVVLVIAYVLAVDKGLLLQPRWEGVVISRGVVYLPLPRPLSNMIVEEAILLRRSIRDYTSEPVKLEHLALMLWAAYGVTDPRYEFRAVPSAGATYPLEVYVVVGERGVLVNESAFLSPGVYKYDPLKHALSLVKPGDFRRELARAALGQAWVEEAPVSIVVFAVFERTTIIYGERGRVRYVPMEVGHLGQNVYLVATALGYGAVVVGAFYDDEVREVVGAGASEVPMYIIPVGKPEKPHYMTFEEIWKFIESMRG
mgnify:CR=1 FL=1